VLWLTQQDPAQFIACTLNVRQKSANADVYGTITGDAIVAGTKPLRDGGMDFSKKVVKKDVKEEKPKVEEKKPEIEKEKPKVEKIALRVCGPQLKPADIPEVVQ
jgi:hypothetical protein